MINLLLIIHMVKIIYCSNQLIIHPYGLTRLGLTLQKKKKLYWV